MSHRAAVTLASILAATIIVSHSEAQVSSGGFGGGGVKTGETEGEMGCTFIYICPGIPPVCDMDDEGGGGGAKSPPTGPGAKPGASSPGPHPPAPPPTARPRAGVTGGRHAPSDGLEKWEAWWSANELRFIGRGRSPFEGVTSRSSAFRSSFERVTPDVVRAQILPTLLLALGDPSSDLQAVAALALARATPRQDAALMRRALRRSVGHPDRSLQRVATLSLGILGDTDALADLAAIAGGDLAGGPDGASGLHPDGFERAYATAALGLLGDAGAVPTLKALLADPTLENDRGIQQAAVLALGIVRGDEARRAVLLSDLVRDPDRSNAARAEAPIALARLAATPAGRAAARGALPMLTGELVAGKGALALRRSIVVALPRIAQPEDREVVEALVATANGASDLALKHLAIIALGELGGGDRDPVRNRDAHLRIEKFLAAEVADEHDAQRRPFGALALALWARNPDLDRETRDRAVALLLAGFDSTKNPSVRGAFAIALGLVGVPTVVEPLVTAFDATLEPGLTGHLAVAIGLAGDRSSGERLRARILEKGHDATLARELALGLALLHDPSAVPTFLEQLKGADTFAEMACAARGLAILGDRSAVAPLVALARDPGLPEARRGLALASLGLLAQREDLAFPTLFRAESNYLDFSPVMAQLASIL